MDFDPVSSIMAWISTYGLLGLFAVALTERFLPVIPSYGLLLAVGIAAFDGSWALLSAFLATVTGSTLGCITWFHSIKRLGEVRSMALLSRTGRLFWSLSRPDRSLDYLLSRKPDVHFLHSPARSDR